MNCQINHEHEHKKRYLTENGFLLDAAAQQALAKIPAGDAAEILEFVTENAGYLKSPSSYICGSALRCLPEWHAKEMLDSLQAGCVAEDGHKLR
eukprot:Skav223054  [mRNA]  locus=scaffold1069:369103:373053:+ [translate_table: standard]